MVENLETPFFSGKANKHVDAKRPTQELYLPFFAFIEEVHFMDKPLIEKIKNLSNCHHH